MDGKLAAPWTAFREAIGSTTNGVLFALAAATRILSWPFLPYHHDEFSALGRLNVANGEGFVAWLKEAVFEDYHPAGAQLFLKAWATLGELLGVPLDGTIEWWIKAPFLASSLAGLVASVFLTRRWFGGTAVGIALALFGSLQWTLLFASVARPYAPGMALGLVFAALATEGIGKRREWTLGLLAACAAYLHHFAGLQAALLGCFLLPWPKLFRVGLIAALFYAPHLPVLAHQLGHGGLGSFLQAPEASFALRYVTLLFNDSWALLFFVAAGGLGGWLYAIKSRTSNLHAIQWKPMGLFLAPLAVAWAYSLYRDPILMDRTLYFGMPFLLIGLSGWMGRGLDALKHPQLASAGTFALYGIGLFTLFCNRAHHIVGWSSAYEVVALESDALLRNDPGSRVILNGPPYAWRHMEQKFDLDLSGATFVDHWNPSKWLGWAQDSSTLAIGRATSYRFMTPYGDAAVARSRGLDRLVPCPDGDFRTFLPPGSAQPDTVLTIAGTSALSFPLTWTSTRGHLDEGAGEVLASVAFLAPPGNDVELAIKWTSKSGDILFYNAVKGNRRDSILALGMRVADVVPPLRMDDEVLVYVWNKDNKPLECRDLTINTPRGNPYLYGWSNELR
jgi:hypothetical protein